MLLATLCAEYIEQNPRVQSAETIRLIGVVCRNFQRFLSRTGKAADLTDANLRAFSRSRRGAGKSLATIDGELSKLMALAKYAAQRGLVPMPLLRVPKSPACVPVAFLRYQIRRLWRAAYRSTTAIGGVPGCIYWPALLDVLWDSGERIRAIYSLSRTDIDLCGRWITFRNRKGQGRPMVKRIRRVTAKNLRRLLQSHVMPEPFAVACMGTIYNQYHTLLADAGLPTDRHSKFHCLRKSHASYLHLAGGDSRASLGHSSDAVTVRHYFDARIVAGRQPIQLLFNPLGLWDRLAGWLGRWFWRGRIG